MKSDPKLSVTLHGAAASRAHECVPYDDPRVVALCEQMGWDHGQFVALQERLTEQMTRVSAAVIEGFCPACKGRLTSSEHGPWCQSCDLYHRITFAEDGCVIGVGAANGSWMRAIP